MIRLYKILLGVLLAVLVPISAFSQSKTASTGKTVLVQGVVTDDEGSPLDGVSVFEKENPKNGTITSKDGSYKLTIATPATKKVLYFSTLGFKDRQMIIGERKTINVKMEPSSEMLEEAVVQTGYGMVQKRSDLTGSAFQVSTQQIKDLPAARVDKMLEGLIPGLEVISNNDNGRTTVKIRVRGDASLSASSEPLWVIDGVPMYTGTKSGAVTGTSYTVSPFNMLNPDDIESITVLKDAATTSIYGADGSNGVILVTTKQGTTGKTSINMSMKYGLNTIDRSTLLKMCSTEQWWELAREGWLNAGGTMEAFPFQDNEHNKYSTTSTYWPDVYLQVGRTSQFNLSARGGSDRMNNYLSASIFQEESPIKGNGQKRFSLSNRSIFELTNRLKIDTKVSAAYGLHDIFSMTSGYYRVQPIFSPYEDDGYTPRLYNWYSNSKDFTVYELEKRTFVYNYTPERDLYDNGQKTLNADGNAMVEWTPIKGLTFASQVGVSTVGYVESYYVPSTAQTSSTSDLKGYSRRSNVFSYTMNNINRLNFNRKFGNHSVNGVAGIQFTDKFYRYVYATGSGFFNDSIKEITYANKDTREGVSNTTLSRALSYYARAEYSYDRRYYLSASWRRDGSSAFEGHSKWDNFWSLGGAYNIQNEPWFNSNIVNTLKLKASYGVNGNSRLDSSAAYGSYVYSSGYYYGTAVGAVQSSPPNPGLSWERTYTQNYGINVSIFKRFDFEVEYYYKHTKDLLYSGRVSSVIENGSVTRNVGEISNEGIEFSITAHIFDNQDFNWSISFNTFHNKNTILKLYKGSHTGFFDYVWMEGASKDAWWLVRWAGVDPADGSPMWYDINGNLTKSFTYDNRVLLPQYSKTPFLQGGIQNRLSWGDLSMSFNINYVLGGWDLFTKRTDGHDIIGQNVIIEEIDHWRKPGDISPNPIFQYKINNNSSLSSTRDLISKTHLTLSNVTLSYSIPKSWCRKVKMKGISVSVIGDNLYLWDPWQSRYRNSYKTFKYSTGMTRSISGQVNFSF